MLDKPIGNSKRVNTRQAMDSHGSGAALDSGTTNLYPTNIGAVGHESKVRKGVVWQWGEGGSLFWGSCPSSFGGNVLLG